MNIIMFTVLTYIFYRVTKWSYKKWKNPLLHPLLLSPLLLILFISCLHIPAGSYLESSRLLTHLLGPATIAFAVPIYKHKHLLKKYFGVMLISVTTGTVVAITSSFFLSQLINLRADFIISILPRSITTPIAIEVSQEIGGLPTLTTVFVIITGIIGGIIGPYAIKLLSLKSPIAKGLALGMGAHGVGTTKAMEFGEQEATFSTLAMILAAWITVIWGSSLIPLLMNITS
ncbi:MULTISPECIES: LrgB family protein [Bacillaceae]|uniref:LrgB family protein n=1 Tax=Bacillaceae TaxID=186817 RepID=UPI001E30A440|nr:MULTISPECIES: LrgB family protein [Bacillaceae]MCE4047382.1 LrgB family protein [Bacillus sp. Au-Bac7]MCM3030661.1 LrgB family protein [Niallia sp. MER 6]MDL0435926.1 LrgB family protein [Niallia sp. SS-2023]UPO86262.1 LrgB family protein [Niallia sp. Man26]